MPPGDSLPSEENEGPSAKNVQQPPGYDIPPPLGVKRNPLRSPQGNTSYDTPPPLGVESNPLRSPQGNTSYDTPPPLGVESNPLRSPQDNTSYDTPPPLGVESNPLRSPQGNTSYDTPPPLGVESNPLRSPQGNTSYDTPPPLGVESNPLRSSQGDTSYDTFDPTDSSLEVSSEGEMALDSPGMEPSPSLEKSTLVMKEMLEHYVETEKQSFSRIANVEGEQVSVHEKEWARQIYNERARKLGAPEATKEQWARLPQTATTQYFNEAQREKRRVDIGEDGSLNKEVFNKLDEGSHIFVMDGKGEVYAENNVAPKDQSGKTAHVHHSSFLAGEAVAGAGELEIGEKGQLKGVTDRSGHYRPGETQTKQTLETLEDKGVSLDNVKFTLDRGDTEQQKTLGMAREFLQGQVTPEEQRHRNQRVEQGGSVSDTSKVMETTFKARHDLTAEIQAKRKTVRETLDTMAEKRATRVEQTVQKLTEDKQKTAPPEVSQDPPRSQVGGEDNPLRAQQSGRVYDTPPSLDSEDNPLRTQQSGTAYDVPPPLTPKNDPLRSDLDGTAYDIPPPLTPKNDPPRTKQSGTTYDTPPPLGPKQKETRAPNLTSRPTPKVDVTAFENKIKDLQSQRQTLEKEKASKGVDKIKSLFKNGPKGVKHEISKLDREIEATQKALQAEKQGVPVQKHQDQIDGIKSGLQKDARKIKDGDESAQLKENYKAKKENLKSAEKTLSVRESLGGDKSTPKQQAPKQQRKVTFN